jgi:uncharacterized membrane protein YjjB (DUF3815 family)
MDFFYTILFTFIASASFAILFGVPPRFLFITSCIGAVSVMSMKYAPANLHIGYVTFFTSFIVACMSHFVAKIKRQPAQIFLIPGIIFLVPGQLIYQAMQAGLQQDLNLMLNKMLTVIAVGFAVSFGILLANWMLPSRRDL